MYMKTQNESLHRHIVFFHNPLQPIPRLHIAVGDFRSNQINAMRVVYSTVLAKKRSQNTKNSWKKTHFSEHLASQQTFV